MERENDWDSDFCDLEPGKICDNCCRCLDMDRDYNEVEVSLLRTDAVVSIGDWEDEGDEYGFGSWEDPAEPEHDEIEPIQIDPALMAEDRLALILGTEGDGLAPETIARCDYTAKIPMSHGVDSLNVAAASAVAFWQLRARD